MIKNQLQALNQAIQKKCQQLDRDLPKLILISKYVAPERIMEAYEEGHRSFGENKVQEFLGKSEQLPSDIEWHFVGHLQTNKVKDLVGKVLLIHSVDSLKLAKVIDRESEKKGIRQSCLIQVNTSGEETKYGFREEDLKEALPGLADLNNLAIEGLMTIAAYTDQQSIIRENFRTLNQLRDSHLAKARELSMGMSHDWEIALEEGATMLRIGTAVFGERPA